METSNPSTSINMTQSSGAKPRRSGSEYKNSELRGSVPYTWVLMNELRFGVFSYSLLHPVTFCFGIVVAVPVQLESIAVYT